MTARTGQGAAMQAHKVRWRIRRAHVRTSRVDVDLNFRIPELRELLRTDLSIQQIADKLDVKRGALAAFIRRRRLCDMKSRKEFISMQASLVKLEDIEA